MFFSSSVLTLLGSGACLAALIAFLRIVRARRSTVSESHLRGRSLKDGERIAKCGAPTQTAAGSGLRIGRTTLPARAAQGHFAFVGATGSGKTILQRLLMQSVVPTIGNGHGNRALIYDAKQDLLSILAGMRPSCPIRLFHPLDTRACAWDMARDITSPNSALQVATILIPQSNKDTNPFFSNAARHLLFGVLSSFILRVPNWTLRQVLLAVRDPQILRQVLTQNETTRHLLQYFEHEGTFQNIVSTILTCTAPYETIAASWDRAPTRFSLRDWLGEESILVLGNDEAHRVAVDTLNRIIFQRLTELILALPEVTADGTQQTWMFLDEVREMGRLDGLSRLLTKGRTKGAAVCLGLQDISGLRDVYGADVAEELLGQCNSKVILRLNGPETAHWASRLFGAREVLERARGQNRSWNFRSLGLDSGSSRGESISNGIAKRDVVLDSEFLDLPETTPQTGLSGFFLNPITGAFRDCIPGDWIARHLLAANRSVPNTLSRPEADQYLRPWNHEDVLALRLEPTPFPPQLRIAQASHEQ